MAPSKYLVPVVLTVSVGAFGCERAQKEKEEVGEAVKDVGRELRQEERDLREKLEQRGVDIKDRTEFMTRVRERLSLVDKDIADLKAEAMSASGEMKRELDDATTDYDKRRAEIAKDLEGLASAGEKDWVSLSNKIDDKIHELEKDVRHTTQRLRGTKRT
jgi:chromosome segregation ATPase